MRTAIVTLVVSLAATVGVAAPSAASERPDGPQWSEPIHAGPEFPGQLLVSPDGTQQLTALHMTANGCTDPSCGIDHYGRVRGGVWAPIAFADAADAFDSQNRAWDVDVQSTGGSTDVTIRSRPENAAWSNPAVVPGLTTSSLVWEPDVFFTDDARPVVTMMTREPGGDYHLLTAEQRTDGTWVSATLDLGATYSNVVATPTSQGTVRFAWREGTHAVADERMADGSWAPRVALPSTAHPAAWVGPDSVVLVDASTRTLSVADRDAGGRWTVDRLSTSYLRGPYVTDTHGEASVAWTTADRTLVVSTRTTRSAWSEPVRVARGLSTFQIPSIVDDPTGNVTVAWAEDDTAGTTHVRQRPVGGSWLPELRVPAGVAHSWENGPALGVDATGRVTLVSSGVSSADLTPPVAVTRVSTSAFHGWTSRPTFRAHWDTTWTRASRHDVRYRLYPSRVRGSFVRTPLVDTSDRTLVTHGPAGTYCLQARAHTDSSAVGPWSERRCVTTPLDDRSFVAGRHWTRTNGETRTRTRDARLVLRHVHASRLALLVDRHSRGVVKVSFAGRSLGTFRLARGAGPQHRIIGLGKLAKVRHGNLVVRVVSNGQPVRIEGVYAGR